MQASPKKRLLGQMHDTQRTGNRAFSLGGTPLCNLLLQLNESTTSRKSKVALMAITLRLTVDIHRAT